MAQLIVLIDEIDAIDRSRGGLLALSGNDEREQTLNQLLGEIDGFKADVARPVIIIAATIRPEILDPALLRAGRFDRQVVLGNPDLVGRAQIQRIHSRNIVLAPDFDLDRAARVTPGFSGADLANAMNKAALLSARRNASAVTFADFQAALERVVGGLEQRSRVMNAREPATVAYHEVVTPWSRASCPKAIRSRRSAAFLARAERLTTRCKMPKEDRYLLSREELEDQLASMRGGRPATGSP